MLIKFTGLKLKCVISLKCAYCGNGEGIPWSSSEIAKWADWYIGNMYKKSAPNMTTEYLESCKLLSLGMSRVLKNPHFGHYLVRQLSVYWKGGWISYTETFLARHMGWMLCSANYCFVKGRDAKSHCCLFFNYCSIFFFLSHSLTE